MDWKDCDEGIIPARAGFTNSQVAGTRFGGGSSPRVRGLRVEEFPAGVDPGIIPARAGFTDLRSDGPGMRADHPRAGGVYARGFVERSKMLGSSPRVRGLQQAPGGRVLPQGIIPARAGFTSGSRPSARAPEDHPRACGVYLGWKAVQRSCERIIPARAGFTDRRTDRPSKRGDHPRACGVYWLKTYISQGNMGSSPRVRGLLRGRG